MRALTPAFGQYTALSAQLSGNLRHTHSRVAEFSEEVAFFGGEETEKMLVEREYAGFVKHENYVLTKRWWHGCVEEGIVKWLWGSFGVRGPRVLQIAVNADSSVVSCAFAPFRRSLSYLAWLRSTWEDVRKVCISVHNNPHAPTLSHCLITGFVTNRRLLLSASGE